MTFAALEVDCMLAEDSDALGEEVTPDTGRCFKERACDTAGTEGTRKGPRHSTQPPLPLHNQHPAKNLLMSEVTRQEDGNQAGVVISILYYGGECKCQMSITPPIQFTPFCYDDEMQRYRQVVRFVGFVGEGRDGIRDSAGRRRGRLDIVLSRLPDKLADAREQ